MRNATIITRWVVRLAGLIQIIVGVALWTGHALGLVNFHMAIGGIFVLALLVLAVLALAARAGWGFAVFAILWGVLVLAFGMTQTRLLIGSAHWVVRLLHLLVGLAAMGIGDRLAERVLRTLAGRAGAADTVRAA